METPKMLLSAAQVAERLQVNVSTVQRRAAAGAIPIAGKLPGETGAFIFDAADIEALAAAS